MMRREVIDLNKLRDWLKKSPLAELMLSPEKSNLRVRILLAVGLLGIALLVFSDGKSNDAGSVSANAAEETRFYGASGYDYEEYTSRLEARLTELISSVRGAGRAKVMITLECGTEYVYASQQKTTSAVSENSDPGGRSSRDEKRSGEENLILIDAGRGEEPLILKEITPTVAGVVVLCSGADDVNVRQQIINVVTTALGTSSNRVCVTGMG